MSVAHLEFFRGFWEQGANWSMYMQCLFLPNYPSRGVQGCSASKAKGSTSKNAKLFGSEGFPPVAVRKHSLSDIARRLESDERYRNPNHITLEIGQHC